MVDDRIHVAHIIWSFGIGGTENGIVNLINNSSDDIRHSVIALTELGDSVQRINVPDVFTAQLGKKSGQDLSVIFRLAKALNRIKPDIVHCRSWATYFESVAASRIAGIPTLIHGEHGTTFFDKPRRVWAYRVLKSMTSHYITVTHHLEQLLREKAVIKNGKVSCIPNGVITEKFKPDNKKRQQIRAELGFNKDDFVVGSAGRLVPVKGYDILIRAIAERQKENPSLKAVLVGDGPIRQELEDIAQKINADIHFTGNSDRVNELYRAFDVYACTSHSEGMSNTIMEALASGIPVIATSVGGNKELIRENQNGVFIPPNDTRALADAIDSLAAQRKKRQTMGTTARQIIEENYSQQQMIDRYISLYQKCSPKKIPLRRGTA